MLSIAPVEKRVTENKGFPDIIIIQADVWARVEKQILLVGDGMVTVVHILSFGKNNFPPDLFN